MNKKEEKLIENRYEFIDWIYKKVMGLVGEKIKQEREELDAYKEKLQEKYELVSEGLRKINSYVAETKRYEKAIDDKIKILTDRDNNLQKIYDKMILIETRLNSGEWPGVLPPLDLDI